MLFETKCVLAVWGSGVLEAMAGLGAVLFSLLLLPKCQILAFGNISIQNRDSSIYKKNIIVAKHYIRINRYNLINRPAIATVFAYFFTLFTFLCNLFYFTSRCIPCLQTLFVLLLFILFLINLVPRRLIIFSLFSITFKNVVCL